MNINGPTAPGLFGTIQFDGSLEPQAEANRLLAEFDKLAPNQKRTVLASMNGLDPDRTIIIKSAEGQLAAREVSYEARARLFGMGAAGFETVAFSNRATRRAEKANARRAAKKRSR